MTPPATGVRILMPTPLAPFTPVAVIVPELETAPVNTPVCTT